MRIKFRIYLDGGGWFLDPGPESKRFLVCDRFMRCELGSPIGAKVLDLIVSSKNSTGAFQVTFDNSSVLIARFANGIGSLMTYQADALVSALGLGGSTVYLTIEVAS